MYPPFGGLRLQTGVGSGGIAAVFAGGHHAALRRDGSAAADKTVAEHHIVVNGNGDIFGKGTGTVAGRSPVSVVVIISVSIAVHMIFLQILRI